MADSITFRNPATVAPPFGPYAYTVIEWAKEVDVDLASYPDLRAYLDRIGARPAVVAALSQESA